VHLEAPKIGRADQNRIVAILERDGSYVAPICAGAATRAEPFTPLTVQAASLTVGVGFARIGEGTGHSGRSIARRHLGIPGHARQTTADTAHFCLPVT
jgi:hypothetical protein